MTGPEIVGPAGVGASGVGASGVGADGMGSGSMGSGSMAPFGGDSITLTGLRAMAHHGVFDFERENGQEFIVDVTVWLDLSAAASGDDLERTLNYGDLATEVSDAVRRDPVDLIETVAERIAGVVLAHKAAQAVRVTVHKSDAPISVPFDDVQVTITRLQAAPRHIVGFGQ